MKVKALIMGLLIAGATALMYTATLDSDAGNQAIDRNKIKVPSHG